MAEDKEIDRIIVTRTYIYKDGSVKSDVMEEQPVRVYTPFVYTPPCDATGDPLYSFTTTS